MDKIILAKPIWHGSSHHSDLLLSWRPFVDLFHNLKPIFLTLSLTEEEIYWSNRKWKAKLLNLDLLHPCRHAGLVNMTKLNLRICRFESWDGFHRRLAAVWRRMCAKFVGSAWRTLPRWQPGAWQMMRGLMNPCSVSQSSSLTFVVFQKWEFALTFAEERWWQSAWACEGFVLNDNRGRQT